MIIYPKASQPQISQLTISLAVSSPFLSTKLTLISWRGDLISIYFYHSRFNIGWQVIALQRIYKNYQFFTAGQSFASEKSKRFSFL